ncbi:MAG: hypothetical protein ABH856_02315 [Patescibacteria group bacterium]|nr:hypothetical protein [Patescibacteria group bacterium]
MQTVGNEADIAAKMKTNRDLFFDLYDNCFDMVYRYAVRRVGHSDYLKRLVNRTFYRAYHQLDRFFDEKVLFSTWILKNAKIVADEMGAPMRGDVDKAFIDLEQDDFEMVLFKVFEGLPDSEISYVLGVEEGAFTPLYYRLLSRLKDKLNAN